MAAMVAPICVEYPQLGLVRIAALGGEISHHLHKVVGVHGETCLPAVCRRLVGLYLAESVESPDRKGVGALRQGKHIEILAARLDGVDQIARDPLHLLPCHTGIEYVKTCRKNLDIGVRTYKTHAFACGRGTLVELARKSLDREMRKTVDFNGVGDCVGGSLAEDTITGLVKKLVGETEQIVDTDKPEIFYIKTERRV